MPSSRFETSSGWIAGRHAEIIAAIQRAVVEGLRIPERDREVRILEYPPEAFAAPPGRSIRRSVLEISMIEGRSLDAKRRLYSALVRELAPFGVGADDLKVIIHEPPLANWGINGKPLTDVTLDFTVEV